jgi:Do/DeqQ family serine protease
MKKYIGIFATATLGGAIALGLNHFFTSATPAATNSLVISQQPVKYTGFSGTVPESGISFVQAADVSVHAVVHVKTSYGSQPTSNHQSYDPFRDFFWGNPHQQPQESSGSGVIISGDGYIVTNNHVIENGEKIEITLNDKRIYDATVVGRDPSTDLALLKITEKDLPYLMYGNSDDVKVGEWVLAVGNPFNLTSTVTAGIVSAKGRNINIINDNNGNGQAPIESFIQTDAAVNPGNSGGALVNTKGELVGINTAIASNTGSYSGYSFAIPVNITKKVVNDLLEFGNVQRAFLGVSIRDIDANFAKKNNINTLNGVYVNGTTEGGAAELAGIKDGDVIVKVANMKVSNTSALLEQIGKFRPGDKITLTVKRNGKEMVLPVTLKNKNGDTKLVNKPDIENSKMLGAIFDNVSADDMKKLGITGGAQITDLEGGKLRSAGINQGFIITAVDKKKINNVKDLETALQNKKGGVLIEGIYPNGMKAYYAFGL